MSTTTITLRQSRAFEIVLVAATRDNERFAIGFPVLGGAAEVFVEELVTTARFMRRRHWVPVSEANVPLDVLATLLGIGMDSIEAARLAAIEKGFRA